MIKPEEIPDVLRYIDLFGTKFTFYTEENPKLYTPLGGFLTFLSILISIFIFVYPNLEDFKQKNPIIYKSIISEGQHKIKFGEEKIWLPWQISNNYFEFYNYTNKLYPIINYYYRENISENNIQILKTKQLSYKLCNETSMINKPDIYYLDKPLNELYCIDMDDILMGGSWKTEYEYYIEFNLFLCKNGENYYNNNENCTSLENLTNILQKFPEIHIYYPNLQYQPKNKSTPVVIIYKDFFYRLSKYSNKLSRIYLQKLIFNDNLGFFLPNAVNKTYWGINSIDSDFYINPDINDLYNINEESTSKIFSFNIFLKSDIIYYKRTYKNIFEIIGYSFPIMHVIYSIFKRITKCLKIATINKKLTELLFEKTTSQLNDKKRSINNIVKEKEVGRNSKQRRHSIVLPSSNNLSSFACSSAFFMNNKKNPGLFDIVKSQQNNIIIEQEMQESPESAKVKRQYKKSPLFVVSNVSNSNSNSKLSQYKLNKLSLSPKKNKSKFAKKEKENSEISIEQRNVNIQNIQNIQNLNNPSNSQSPCNTINIQVKNLFPFRYYFCLIFINNVSLDKNSTCLSKKFWKVQNFLCKMFDISSYITLYVEFNRLKEFIDKPILKIIEKKNKINVNNAMFSKEVSEDFDNNQFLMFGRSRVKSNNNIFRSGHNKKNDNRISE